MRENPTGRALVLGLVATMILGLAQASLAGTRLVTETVRDELQKAAAKPP